MVTDSSLPNAIIEATDVGPSLTVDADPQVFADWRHDVANAVTLIFLTCEHAQASGKPLDAERIERILQAAEELQALHGRLIPKISESEAKEL